MAKPIWQRLIEASGRGLLQGRVVITADMLEEWLGLAIKDVERVSRLDVVFEHDTARMSVDVRALKKPTRIDLVVAIDDAAIDAERFYLRLAIRQKPRVVEEPTGEEESTFGQALEALGGAALNMISVETLVRLVGNAAQPVVQGDGNLILIDFNAIEPVRALFARQFPFGRLRDIVSLKNAAVTHEGLVIHARLHPREIARAAISLVRGRHG